MVASRVAGWALNVILVTGVSACCRHHVQLMFPPNNASAKHYVCTVGDVDARPEHRQAKCTPEPGGPSAEVGNTGVLSDDTVRVDMEECPSGVYKTITVMDADSSHPKVHVSCGQRAELINSGGGGES